MRVTHELAARPVLVAKEFIPAEGRDRCGPDLSEMIPSAIAKPREEGMLLAVAIAAVAHEREAD